MLIEQTNAKLLWMCPVLLWMGTGCGCFGDFSGSLPPENLTPEVALVDLRQTEFDSTVLESEAPETVLGEVLDPLDALDGCWGTFVTKTCGTECFWECQEIRVLNIQKQSSLFARHHYITPSFMDAQDGTYELSADDRITARFETETYFDGASLVTRRYETGPFEFRFTLVGDLLIEYLLVDEEYFLPDAPPTFRRVYKRFDCPSPASGG